MTAQLRAGVTARYVVDAPTVLHLVDHEMRLGAGIRLVAPGSIRSEVLQLLLDDVVEGRRTEKDALATHERVTSLTMRLLGDRVSRGTAWRIARRMGWTTLREAEYLAVAQLQADALVTVDAGLAAMAEGIVPVAPLTALFDAG